MEIALLVAQIQRIHCTTLPVLLKINKLVKLTVAQIKEKRCGKSLPTVKVTVHVSNVSQMKCARLERLAFTQVRSNAELIFLLLRGMVGFVQMAIVPSVCHGILQLIHPERPAPSEESMIVERLVLVDTSVTHFSDHLLVLQMILLAFLQQKQMLRRFVRHQMDLTVNHHLDLVFLVLVPIAYTLDQLLLKLIKIALLEVFVLQLLIKFAILRSMILD